MKYYELREFITKKMQMAPGYNYQPVVIRTLLQNDGKATREQIEEELKNENKHLLPWKKTDLPFQKLIQHSVCRRNDSTKEYELLDFDEIKTHAQWQAVLVRDCNERIKEMEEKRTTWWIMSAGRANKRVETWNEFRDSNTVGFFWNDVGDLSKLSEDEIKEGFKKYKKDWGPGRDILKIKKDDVIFVKEGKVGFYGIARAIDTYQFNTKRSYHHTIPVEWITTEHIDTKGLKLKVQLNNTLSRIDRKEEVQEYYERAINGNYFVITSQEVSKYDDEEGKQYHFPLHIPNAKKFVKGTNFVVQRKNPKGQYYFMGYGKVGEVEKKEETNEKGKQVTMGTATYSRYTEFNPQKLRTEKIGNEFDKIAFPGGKPNIRPSMLEISYSLYREITGGDLIKNEKESEALTKHSRIIEILERKKNIILYGPPGTGKTFTAKKIAEQMNGISKTVTFHQSYGYEEFIEGIRPVPTKNSITYPVKPGVFKKFCNQMPKMNWKQAAIYVLNEENTSMHHKEINDKSIELEIEPELTSGKSRKTPWLTQLKEITEDIRLNGEDSIFKKSVNDAGIELAGMYEINKESVNYQNEIESLPSVEDNDEKNPKILIIDEINRGNISKIFGELITIIENDKRGTEITLAYSGEKFSVPKNVYIIGTMNTADQSLTHIDAALKRRFSSIEVMPDSSILKKGMKNLPELLDKINEKIREKRSRDNQIGHSYFMHDGKSINEIKELQFVFATDIIPLLRDYFYDSDDDLKDVLGEQFIDWDEGSDRNVKEDWQNNIETFRTAIEKAYDIRI